MKLANKKFSDGCWEKVLNFQFPFQESVGGYKLMRSLVHKKIAHNWWSLRSVCSHQFDLFTNRQNFCWKSLHFYLRWNAIKSVPFIFKPASGSHKKNMLYNLVCGTDGFRAFCLNRLFAQVSRGTVNAMASPEVVTWRHAGSSLPRLRSWDQR